MFVGLFGRSERDGVYESWEWVPFFFFWGPKSINRMTFTFQKSYCRNMFLLYCDFRHLDKTLVLGGRYFVIFIKVSVDTGAKTPKHATCF